ncbi:MAG: UDP-3-O-(3-hydroxymyristoyl)glucosamine N-acyltransferase [Chthonomonadaceae bacterium]|nr:UDP-3-O-(3-hydroxymyristoyl)glucosamine N-acyltransferase [Chthonomonadaceae bacterium]
MAETRDWTLEELSKVAGGNAQGGPVMIKRPVPVGTDDPEGITFAEGEDYLALAAASGVGAVVVPNSAPPIDKPTISVESPRIAFFRILTVFDRIRRRTPGVHATAIVEPAAKVSPSASVGPYAVIDDWAVVGDGAIVESHSYVGPGCVLGQGSIVMPHAVLVQDVTLGEGALILSGAVLGGDGFGFVWDGKTRMKIPQVGSVSIGENAEIGANSTVDRAMTGATIVGDGTKIDNLVQIGHNSRIGRHTVLAGQVGVSGSVVIGDRVVCGGQVAFADHVTVCDDVMLAGRTGLMHDVTEPGSYFGVPAEPIKKALRQLALVRKLPELLDRIKKLEDEIETLKNER